MRQFGYMQVVSRIIFVFIPHNMVRRDVNAMYDDFLNYMISTEYEVL